METIKFKAFIKDNKTMASVWRMDFDNQFIILMDKNKQPIKNEKMENFDFKFNEVEIMQFIGLYDCNNKEIYENDIIEIHHYNGKRNLFEIKFIQGQFYAHPIDNKYINNEYKINRYLPERIKIVGNALLPNNFKI